LGTRVAAFVEGGGAYADRVLTAAAATVAVPGDLPAAAIAAVFLQGTTAHWAVHRYGRSAPGETVLVHAAGGGVGVLAVQLANLAGARVIATASSEEKRATARRLGAAVALDSSRPDELAAAVREASDGRGADVVVDGVGGPLFAPSLDALAFNGRYVITGSASQSPAQLDARRLLVRGQSVCGFILARVVEREQDEPGRTLLELCELVRVGSLTPIVETMPLERAAEAHRRLDERRVTGKIVLTAAGAEERR
jgi:NADPH2:quinone reductase